MKTTKPILRTLLSLAMLCAASVHAEEDEKIAIVLGAFATPDTRLSDTFRPIPMPDMSDTSLPYTPEQIASLSGRAQASAIEANDRVMRANWAARTEVAWRNYERADQEQKIILQKLRDSTHGRILLTMRDTFASEILNSPFKKFFKVILRTDAIDTQTDAALQEKNDTCFAEAGYIVRLVVHDPERQIKRVKATDTIEITRVTLTEVMDLHVTDFSGNMIVSKTIEETVTEKRSNVTQMSGDDGLRQKVIRQCLKSAVATLGEELVKYNLTVEISSADKDDEDFDADNAEISLDGEEDLTAGESAEVARGKHTVTVSLDGYKEVKKTITIGDKLDTVLKLKLKKNKASAADEE